MDPNNPTPPPKKTITRKFVNKYLFSASLEIEADNEVDGLTQVSKLIYNNAHGRVDTSIRMNPVSTFFIRKVGTLEILEEGGEK